MEKLTRVIIETHTEIATGAYLIKFKRIFNFIPGQILGITIDQNVGTRLYSVCSSPNDDLISILYTVKEDGQLTPRLASAKPGDLIWITKPTGKFIPGETPVWWIATGTGIAPFYSMFRSGIQPLKLIHGGRRKQDLYFYQELRTLPDYVPCCSQEEGPEVFAGRLTVYINELEQFPDTINYYLCGSAEMVVDVRNLLISKGVRFDRIITEIYF